MMMHSIARKSCLISLSLLSSPVITGISPNGVKPAIGSFLSRGSSAIRTFKSKVEEEERRFPPQNQESQPGKEYLMNPRPLFANPHYMPSNKLKGKVALVAGGDSGIGRSLCYHFAKEGASVAFTYVKGDEDIDAKDTLDIINESKMEGSVDPIAIPSDLRYDKNCKTVVDEVIGKYGQMDILVILPAVQYYTYSYTLEVITEERLEKVFRTNMFSYFFLTKHALMRMKEGSSIINITSVLAYSPDPPSWLDYTSTKGVIVSLTKGSSIAFGREENSCERCGPWSYMDTTSSFCPNDADIARFGSTVPMNRAGQPYEIAPSYVFLASKDSSYMTGQVLHPNGIALKHLHVTD